MDGSHGAHIATASPLFAEVSFQPPPVTVLHGDKARRRYNRCVGGVIKRTFDIAASASALIVLSPILLAVWLMVRIESRGPGLFRQRRSGFQGRPFHILKFRTMKTCENRSITQAKQKDDRTTRLGRILRRFSIDELPQLVNVLRGDMSIVGPRPHALAHDREFTMIDRRYMGRYHARPGITGLAQVSGARGATDTTEKVLKRMEFDLTYVASWSLAKDATIILRTATLVFTDKSVF